jgi:chitin disaccharide deacetylase
MHATQSRTPNGSPMNRFLIVTADDFGLHEAVNAAVEQAVRARTLTAASLMVSAPACADAVRRARALPGLRVGLHVTLADGRAELPAAEIPHLVDASGRFAARSLARAGWRWFIRPALRRELAAEIRAQFRAFERTGLELDHVNVHKHLHLHPTVLDLILEIGREFGMRAMRLPAEPRWFAAQYESIRRGSAVPGRVPFLAALAAAGLAPWVALLRRRLDAAGLGHNDHVFGLRASGAMDEPVLLAILDRLPPGVTEIYLHPATCSGEAIAPSMSSYRHAEELAALLSPRVAAAMARSGAARGGFLDLSCAGKLRPA